MARRSEPESTGTFAQPPAHAPREVSQPLSDALIAENLRKALAHERVLPPFDPPPMPEGALAPPLAVATEPIEPAEVVAAPPSPIEAKPYQPAASNSESPSRGVPRRIDDPNKAITGGFSGPAAQYFALDGSEARAMACDLMEVLKAKLATHLNFSLALTYPSVRVRVTVTLDNAPTEQGLLNEPIDVHAERVFTLDTEAVDDAETPPDAHRDRLGLVKPRKQAFQTGSGRVIADVSVSPLGSPR